MQVEICYDGGLGPKEINNTSTSHPIVQWSELDTSSINTYTNATDILLSKINIPADAINCKNSQCKNPSHCNAIDKLYNDIVSSLRKASVPLTKKKM